MPKTKLCTNGAHRGHNNPFRRCQDCKNEWQKEHRRRIGNADTRQYEKTQKGFLVRKYRNMLSRVRGIQQDKAHLYLGLEIVEREDFYSWADDGPNFHLLWEAWVEAGYTRSLCPTVDRIDPTKGYTPNNMRWITHGENSSLGGISSIRKYGAANLLKKRWNK